MSVLSALRLRNFKAFIDTGLMTFAPLTLLCGVNSSGKSSILQSLLMLKQSLDSPAGDDPIVMNGTLVALGYFGDVYCAHAAPDESLSVTVVLRLPSGRDMLRHPFLPFREYAAYARCRPPWYRPLGWLRLSTDVPTSQEDHLVETHLDMRRDPIADDKLILGNVTIRTGSLGALAHRAGKYISLSLESDARSALQTRLSLPSELLQELAVVSDTTWPPPGDGKNPPAYMLKGFLPDYEMVECNTVLLEAQLTLIQEVGELLKVASPDSSADAQSGQECSPLVGLSGPPAHEMQSASDQPETLAPVETLTAELSALLESEPDLMDQTLLRKLLDRVRRIPPCLVPSLERMLSRHRDTIGAAKLAQPSLIGNPRRSIAPAASYGDPSVEDLADFVRMFFTNGLYHLGPLRIEPQAVFRSLNSPDSTYVGQHGENTAFVLQYHGDRYVRAVLPPSEAGGEANWNPLDSEAVPTRVSDAVNGWLRYLGVAEQVIIKELGKMGVSIRAKVAPRDPVADLTNVGVGVSQVLPLLVLGLIAPPGSVILLEQPELHLHPYVQSRLVDFLLSLTAVDKQVVVETHSEHLVHRLRLWVAKGVAAPGEDVRILFTDRDLEFPGACVKEIGIGRLGEVQEWPRGFLDETGKVLGDIARAALQRVSDEECQR